MLLAAWLIQWFISIAYGGWMLMVLAGDSHLTETSPRRPVTKLAPRLRMAGVDVVSVAVGGSSSRDLLGQQIPGDADWVLFSVGVNDAAPWKRLAIDEFAGNCDRVLGATGSTQRLVLGPGPVVERGLPGQRTNAVLSEYASVLEHVASVHSARFVALVDLLDVADLADDGVHFNDSGYRKLAERVLVEVGAKLP